MTNLLRFGSWNIGRSCNMKLQHVLEQAIQLDLHIVALQEIGEPTLYQQKVKAAGYQFYMCTHQYAGVGLLVQKLLVPLIKQVNKREAADGRLIGLELQINEETMVIMSAYIHSGIDFVGNTDEKLQQAQSIYNDIKKWKVRGSKVVVMGDLNETISDLDREYNSTVTKHSQLITQLSTSLNMIDTYRTLHPLSPGFTHYTTSTNREVKSRLDYIFTYGWSIPALQYFIIQPSDSISHHCLIHIQIQTDNIIKMKDTIIKVKVPNLRNANENQKNAMVEEVETELSKSFNWILSKTFGSRKDIDECTSALSSMVYNAACTKLGMTGTRKWKNKEVGILSNQRKALTSLLHLTQQIHKSNKYNNNSLIYSSNIQWNKKYNKCYQFLHLHQLAHPHKDYNQFELDCKDMITVIRKQIKMTKLKLVSKKQADDFNNNTTAAVNRMLKQDEPSQLTSIIDPLTGALITDSERMKQVLHDGFAKVFALPMQTTAADIADSHHITSIDMALAASLTPTNAPSWYKEVYQNRRESIKSEWYNSLMDEISTNEMKEICSACPYYAAPGHDGVSAGVWRLLSEKSECVNHILALLLSACLRLHMMPSIGKKSIIVPIPKKRGKPNEMSNIRPISLQSALTKLLSKLLAARLANILASHSILHSAQEAFIKNGAISNCVDTWLDVWEISKSKKLDCFNLFYDIKAAYDSVQHMDLLRSLHRLRLPIGFITLVADSLCDLTSCVRTVYGMTNEFPVQRSVRQGDPLAPLLYVMFMDSLHAGMECNPLPQHYHMRDGFKINKDVAVASKGFADDTTAFSSTLAGLSRINDWVHAWIAFNHCELHPTKTQLVGRYRNQCMINDVNLCVANVVLQPSSLDEPISYLGLKVTMNLNYKESVKKCKALIAMFTSRILAYRLNVEQAVIVINQYLIPKIDLLLRYINVSDKALEELDMMITKCMVICSGVAKAIRGTTFSALTGLVLPSQHEVIAKISECFIRLNNNILSSYSGRLRWSEADYNTSSSYSSSDSDIVFSTHNTTNRLVRIKYLTTKMNWKLVTLPKRSKWNQNDLVPSNAKVQNININNLWQSIVFDYIGEWGSQINSSTLVAYTDGSHSKNNIKTSTASSTISSSSWGVCFAEDWFIQNYASLPLNEKCISMRLHLTQACVIGGKIDTNISQGIFMAELQAIYRALQAVPITCNMTIITDSKSAMDALHAYQSAVSNRKKMRMIGRPLLAMIVRLMNAHTINRSEVKMKHIASHSSSIIRTQHQAGNSCADRVADYYRSTTLNNDKLNQLPLQNGENWMYALQADKLVTSDIRTALQHQMKEYVFEQWSQLSSHKSFAVREVKHLCELIIQTGNYKKTRCVLALLTDSIQYHSTRADRTEGFGQYQCASCCAAGFDLKADVKHVLSCPFLAGTRDMLTQVVYNELCLLSAVKEWMNAANVNLSVCTLQDFLCCLFDVKNNGNDICYRLMIGAFSDEEASKALKSKGCKEGKESWQKVIDRIRMLLFNHIYRIWCDFRV